MSSALRWICTCIAFFCFLCLPAYCQYGCWTTGDGGQVCCDDFGKCSGHCIDVTVCDVADDLGANFCFTGYGDCCNVNYTSQFAGGETCNAGGRYYGPSHSEQGAGLDEIAQALFVPSTCTKTYHLVDAAVPPAGPGRPGETPIKTSISESALEKDNRQPSRSDPRREVSHAE